MQERVYRDRVVAVLPPGSVRSFYQPGVTFIPIQPEPPPLDLVGARPAGEPPPTVAAFLDVLRQQLPRIRSKYAAEQKHSFCG